MDTTPVPEQPGPASRSPACTLSQCQCSGFGSPCGKRQTGYSPKRTGAMSREVLVQHIHSHLHVSEALDAEQRLVLCREEDVGLLMESCRDRGAF